MIRCYDCGGFYKEATGYVHLETRQTGPYNIYLEKYLKCHSCPSILFNPFHCREIEKVGRELQNKSTDKP